MRGKSTPPRERQAGGQAGGRQRHQSGLPPGRLTALFRRRLLRWYARHARDLPWRRTRDPYAVVVSEFMLQQTQVSRVLEYYPRFLERFPDVHALARSRPRAVREAWEGLGYYARARNLHQLARQVASHHDGRLPAEPEELVKLPGVGRYTAGAVASFAYEQPVPAVDTNVARVIRRVFVGEGRMRSAEGGMRNGERKGARSREQGARSKEKGAESREQGAKSKEQGAGSKEQGAKSRERGARSKGSRLLWEMAEQIVPRNGKTAWRFNQAIMELGALVCTARAPKCSACPVRRQCKSVREHGAESTEQ